ncbi:MAG: TetR/AcrR family transcriptional regulator [Pseudomonadota bacterium]
MAEAAQNVRPTQEQRTDAMRARLLEATLDVIAEEGWAQTSTQKICKRAGVSRGAQTHHFPTRDSLLIAAVREMVARYQRDLNANADDREGHTRRLEDAFDFLWEACFEGHLLDCWMDVMVAARTDDVLRPAVRETDATAIASMRAMGDTCPAETVNEQVSSPDLIELTVYLLRGMVVQAGVHSDQPAKQRLFELWKRLVL